MKLPPGFQVTLCAGEPTVVQPIAFTFDDRGRLWVVECNSYPQWSDKSEGHDRVLIFEDTRGDGHFDSCKVFWDKGVNLSGIEFGFGGIWLCSTPRLLFIPLDADRDCPAGPPQVVLDGWDLAAKHNVFNSLTWGPDGWLYGCNGILSNSLVGLPGTPPDKRVALNCGVWRYHPIRKDFEVVAHGTTNPWGLDFDDYGRLFITNCVIKHLFYVVPGAHYQRMFGQDINPFTYGLMPSCADHIHWAGGDWTSSRGGKGDHSNKGGGHAHVGAMIYLGNNWPDEYRNNVFMCNIHGNRLNRDILEPAGSGVVARHGPDFLFANDEWFRGLAVKCGPDGGAFLTDWCDTGECHNYVEVDRTNGRIYKITYGQTKPFHGDLAKLADAELVKFQSHKNDWFVRHARRLLQERAFHKTLDKETRPSLGALLRDSPDVRVRLRALWALHATGGVEEAETLRLLGPDHKEHLDGWTITLACEATHPSPRVMSAILKLDGDAKASTLLAMASALQRLPRKDAERLAEVLVRHSECVKDDNLPLMIWYGLEPLVAHDPSRGLKLLSQSRVSLLRQLLTRRLIALPEKSGGTPPISEIVSLLEHSTDPGFIEDVLQGVLEAYKGRRHVPKPSGWNGASKTLMENSSESGRELALELGAIFDDEHALKLLRESVLNPKASSHRRHQALETLVFKNEPDLLDLLKGLLADPVLKAQAIRGLAGFKDDRIPGLLLGNYSTFTPSEKADVVQTLASRPGYALYLLEAIDKGRVPRGDVSAFTVRQMVELKNKEVSDRVAKVWGAVRSTTTEKAAQMAKYKSRLTPDFLKGADLAKGRQVFAKTCATCHRLFDDGARIGPELTGSQRANIQYFLENVIDPSAIVAREYQMSLVELKNGRVISGIIKEENDHALTMQTQNEAIVVPKKEIDSRTQSPVSMMPEGLMDKLTLEEIRDLAGYLASPNQVPVLQDAVKPPTQSKSGARK